MKVNQTYRPENNRNFQLTRNGSFQLKRFPAYFVNEEFNVMFRLSTFVTNQFYFETFLN